MIARIVVTPKKSVLDPQGEAVRRAIHTLGMDCVTSTRVGKYVELEISGKDLAKTRAKLEEISRDLLSNPVVEDYRIELEGEAAPALKPATTPAVSIPVKAPAQIEKPKKEQKEKEKAESFRKVDKKGAAKLSKKVSKKK